MSELTADLPDPCGDKDQTDPGKSDNIAVLPRVIGKWSDVTVIVPEESERLPGEAI